MRRSFIRGRSLRAAFSLQERAAPDRRIFTNENLHFDRFLPCMRGRPGNSPGAIGRRRRYHRAEPLERGCKPRWDTYISPHERGNTPESSKRATPTPRCATAWQTPVARAVLDGWTRGALAAAAPSSHCRPASRPAVSRGPVQVLTHISERADLRRSRTWEGRKAWPASRCASASRGPCASGWSASRPARGVRVRWRCCRCRSMQGGAKTSLQDRRRHVVRRRRYQHGFNFYTKRATLAGVYLRPCLLAERPFARSGGDLGFLDRRIDDVMKSKAERPR